MAALLKIEEVCMRIKTGRTKVYEMIGKGELPPPLKIGNRSRWVESEIDGFIVGKVKVRDRFGN